jgi:hypothetical protein
MVCCREHDDRVLWSMRAFHLVYITNSSSKSLPEPFKFWAFLCCCWKQNKKDGRKEESGFLFCPAARVHIQVILNSQLMNLCLHCSAQGFCRPRHTQLQETKERGCSHGRETQEACHIQCQVQEVLQIDVSSANLHNGSCWRNKSCGMWRVPQAQCIKVCLQYHFTVSLFLT